MKHVIRLILTVETTHSLTAKDLLRRAHRACELIHEHINEDADENILSGSECTYDVASEGDPLYSKIMTGKTEHEARVLSEHKAKHRDYPPMFGSEVL